MRRLVSAFFISEFQINHEKIYKPDFVSRYRNGMPVIYLRLTLLQNLS